MSLTDTAPRDDEIVQLLRSAYSAVVEEARSDPIVFRDSGVAEALDAINHAGHATQAFFKKCRAAQANKFADSMPSYDDSDAPTEPGL